MWQWFARFWQRSTTPVSLGNRGETLASQFLERQGMRILERQYRGNYGELDLVAQDGDTVVFIEVKTRTTAIAGDPTEAVTPTKQKKITQSALAYLKRRRWLNRRTRFDVVSILWNGPGGEPEIRHYPSAFEATGSGQMYS
jgi:putative endonuclease